MDDTENPAAGPSLDGSSLDEPAGESELSKTTTQISALRVWPAIVLVVLMWSARVGGTMVTEPSVPVMMATYMGPLAASALILIWWLLFSRATWKERLIGTGGLLAILGVTTALTDKTVFGIGTMVFAIPWGTTLFALGATLARRRYPARTAVALAAALIGFGYWDLVRHDEFHANFKVVENWRWEPTAEERFVESLASRPSKPEVESRVDTIERLADPEWAGFRGADRRGVQPGVALAEDWQAQPPTEVWRVPIGPGWSSFAVAGNRLFTQEQRGELEAVVCYSAGDGSELWVHQDASRFWETIGGAGPRATPTIADAGLYTLGASGLLNRLDPLTGRVVWRRDLREDAKRSPPEWGFASSPLVTRGLVIVFAGGGGDKGLLAYDQATGAPRWSAPGGNHTYSSPQASTLDGKECVLMVTNEGLDFVDPESGSVIGRHAWEFNGYRVIQPLVLDSSSLLLGTPMEGTQRIDVRWDGNRFVTETRWATNRMKPYFNDYVVHDGFLYGFDNNIFACVDLRDGAKKWKKGRYGNGQVLLLPEGGQLLLTSELGELVLLRASPDDLVELGRHAVLDGRTWNHPVVVGDRVYVRNGAEAACFKLPVQPRG